MNEDVVIIGGGCAVIAIASLGAVGIAIFSKLVQHRQFKLLLDERKLLRERGVTDLPPLELPEMAGKGDRLRNLKAGVILLFIAGAFAFGRTFGVVPFGMPRDESGGLAVILAAIGLALLVIHAISSHYERREAQEQGPSGEDNASVIEVDIEE